MRTLLIAALLVMGILPSAAQNVKTTPTMAIKGEGSYSIKPDYATFTVTVSNRTVNAEEATATHRGRTAKVGEILTALKSDGVTVSKTSFTIRTEKPDTERDRWGRPEAAEYVATTTYVLEARQIGALTKIVSWLAESDLFELSSIRFKADNPRKAQLEARKAAVQDAREQAETYAKAAGLRLVEIAEITDGEATRDSSVAYDLPSRKMAPPSGGQLTEIIPPATLEFTASVNMVWRISSR